MQHRRDIIVSMLNLKNVLLTYISILMMRL